MPGYGIGWVDLDPDADPPVVEVALRPELIVRGRLFDVKGQPAPGIALRTELIHLVVCGTALMPIARPDFEELRLRDFPAWPGPAISDDQGRFSLRGLSRDMLCRLFIDDPRFSLPLTTLQTGEKVDDWQSMARLATIKVDPGPDPRRIAIALQPAKRLSCALLYADTGAARSRALAASGPRFSEADAEGRFRIPAGPGGGGRFGSPAQPPDGGPYLMTFKQVNGPRGSIEQSVDTPFPGVWLSVARLPRKARASRIAGAVVLVTSPASGRRSSAERAVPSPDGPRR